MLLYSEGSEPVESSHSRARAIPPERSGSTWRVGCNAPGDVPGITQNLDTHTGGGVLSGVMEACLRKCHPAQDGAPGSIRVPDFEGEGTLGLLLGCFRVDQDTLR